MVGNFSNTTQAKPQNVVFEKFGTTMEQLVDEGELWIMSKAAAPQWVPDESGKEYLVSVQYFVVMGLISKGLKQKYSHFWQVSVKS